MKDFIKRHKWEVPLYIIAAGLPLIVCYHSQSISYGSEAWFTNAGTWTDFFLYGKSRCVHFLALFMAAVLIVGTIRKKNGKFGKEWLLAGVFGILQLVSAFMSSYPEQSFFGSIEQYESIWVLLGYLVIGCYAYRCVVNIKNPKTLFTALFIGAAVSCLIGITQIFQMDFWSTEIGRAILIPEAYEKLRESLRFSFGTDSLEPVYLAAYNPNYAGIYLLMLLPCIFLWENKKVRILGFLASICLIGTMSKTVLLAAVLVLIIGIVLFHNTIPKKYKKIVYTGAGAGCLLFCAGILLFGHDEINIADDEKLQAVVCEEEYIHITYQDEKILFRDVPQMTGGVKYEVLYEDGSKAALKWNEESGELEPYDEKLQGLSFKVYEKNDIRYAMFRYNDIPFRFSNDLGTGKYEYISISGKVDELSTAETFLEGHDGFISGRGYIWSRTLPIVLENALFGTGPDTFLQVFPQDDYVARSNLGHAFFTQTLTNAHSLCLQMAVQTGLPSVLCFLGFLAVYLRKCWKMYYGKMGYTSMEKMGIAVFLGITAYLICGMTFASSVCTTPIFWLLLGTGIGINQLNSME